MESPAGKIKKIIIHVLLVLFIISAAILAYSDYTLSEEARIKSDEIGRLTDTLNIKNEILSVIQAKHISVINLYGQDANPNGYGKIIWNISDNSAVLQVSNLMPATSKEDYQLWLVKGDTSISEGVFKIRRPDSENIFKIDSLHVNNLNNLDSIMLTLEKRGGSPKPEGIIYLLGNPSS